MDELSAIAAFKMSGIHSVLTVCGVVDINNRDLICTSEGLTLIADLGVFYGNHDVADMAKTFSIRTVNYNPVNLNTVHIKKAQALVWWINDRQNLRQDLNPYGFNQETMLAEMQSKGIKKEYLSSDVASTTLAKVVSDDFETHEDSFMNTLSLALSISKKCPLRYAVRPPVIPAAYVDDFEERIFQMPINGPDFDSDNRTVYRKLKAFFSRTAWYAWIEQFDKAENGREAFKSWVDHYNGTG